MTPAGWEGQFATGLGQLARPTPVPAVTGTLGCAGPSSCPPSPDFIAFPLHTWLKSAERGTACL